MDEPSYHYLDDENEQRGPLPEKELRALAEGGRILHQTLVWTEGWPDWRPAHTVPGLFRTPPSSPVPGAAGGLTSPRVPWGIPAMPPAGYRPETFMTLFWWWFIGGLISTVVLAGGMIFAVIMFIKASPGEPDAEALIALGLGFCGAVPIMILPVVLWYVLLYKSWRQIQDGYAETSPGKAVGFMFIPGFNIYWQFVALWGLAKDLAGYAERYGVDGVKASPGLALGTVITMLVASVAGGCAGVFALPVYMGAYVLWIIMTWQLAVSSRAVAGFLAGEPTFAHVPGIPVGREPSSTQPGL